MKTAQSGGLLGGFMSQLQAGGLKTKPEMLQDKIIIKIMQDEVSQMAMKGLTQQAQNSIKVELHEGYMQITVQLF